MSEIDTPSTSQAGQMSTADRRPEEKDAQTADRKQAAGNKRLRYSASYAAIALLSFLAIDASLRAFWRPDPYGSPNRSWAWWAVKDFRQQPSPPEVAVLGSSLMLAVLNDGDSTYLNQPFDAVIHHRALYLEKVLSSRLGRPVRTASFAIGGQMASDAYAIISTILKGTNKPKLIIWGIAPRDLIDSTFPDPQNSETVRYMNKLAAGHNALFERKPFWTVIEEKIGSALYLFGKRQDVWCLERDASKQLLSRVLSSKDLDSVHTPMPILKDTMATQPEDCGIAQWMVTPYSPEAKPFSDNTAEYRVRYNPFKPAVFAKQVSYLEKVLSYCQSNGIKLALVNMPLTQANLSLLPQGVYERYLETVKAKARQYDAQLLDFNKPGTFKAAEFADYVHLNGRGGMRFFERVAAELPSP